MEATWHGRENREEVNVRQGLGRQVRAETVLREFDASDRSERGAAKARAYAQGVLAIDRLLRARDRELGGGRKAGRAGLRRIRETERFQARLAEVVRPEEIPQWLDAPNDAFGGLKPLEVIERGEIDRLWNMIYYLDSGVTS